ncbi:MAG: hypothetical protein WDW36_001550 [Sanguina aurantia]
MLCTPFTLAVYMVRDFLHEQRGAGALDEQEVGRRTGLLAAMYSFAQCATSLGLAAVSNRMGRKPVCILGNVACMIGMLWFGLAPTYAWAMAARVFAGALNGILGAWKAPCLGTCHSRGGLVQLLVRCWGGALSHPCDNLPHASIPWCGEGQLMRSRPYFLPCLVGSLSVLIALLLTLFVLEESLPAALLRRQQRECMQHSGTQPGKAWYVRSYLGLHHGTPPADSKPKGSSTLLPPGSEGGLGLDNTTWGDIEKAEGEGWVDLTSGVKGSDAWAQSTSPAAAAPAAVAAAGDLETVVKPASAASAPAAASAAAATAASDTAATAQSDSKQRLLSSSHTRSDSPTLDDPQHSQSLSTQGLPNTLLSWAALSRHRDQRLRSSRSATATAAAAATSPPSSGPTGPTPHSAPTAALQPTPATHSSAHNYHHTHLQAPGAATSDTCYGEATARGPEQALDGEPACLLPRIRSSPRHSDCGAGLPSASQSPSGCSSSSERHLGAFADTHSGPQRPGGEADARGAAPMLDPACVMVVDAGGLECSKGCGTTTPPPVACSSAVDAAANAVQSQAQRPHGSGSPRHSPQHEPAPLLGPAATKHDAAMERAIEMTPLLQRHSQSAHSHAASPPEHPSCTLSVTATEGGYPELQPWYRDRMICLAIAGYSLCCLLYCALDEVLPIFAAAPTSAGGLDLAVSELSWPLAFNGVILMGYSVLGFPPLQRRLGTQLLTRLGLVASTATCFIIPLIATCEPGSALAVAVLYTAMFLKAIGQSSAFTGSIIFVNAAPPKIQLGTVNGVGQTLASFVRGVGPAAAGILWSACISMRRPGQQFLPFVIVAVTALFTCWLYGYVRIKGLR